MGAAPCSGRIGTRCIECGSTVLTYMGFRPNAGPSGQLGGRIGVAYLRLCNTQAPTLIRNGSSQRRCLLDGETSAPADTAVRRSIRLSMRKVPRDILAAVGASS